MEQNIKNQLIESNSLPLLKEKDEAEYWAEDANPRLADFIHENTDEIVSEWEIFAKTLTPAANAMTPSALRNHIRQMLDFIVTDIKSSQTGSEQIQKSQGEKEQGLIPTAAETHAALRLAGGFDIDQIVSEFRALRASVVKLWSRVRVRMNRQDLTDLIRFNESIDQEVGEAVSHYTRKISHSKDLLMSILSHSLRTPLNVIAMSINRISQGGGLNRQQAALATQIFETTSHLSAAVNNLIDATQARFGAGLPVRRIPMDMALVCRQVVNDMRTAYPTQVIFLEITGNVNGEWDEARIGQVFSNLLGNAIQYGFKDTPIELKLNGMANELIVSVHNEGLPIRPEIIRSIFESSTSGSECKHDFPIAGNLGLGLFITKDIVVSHGGTIRVISSDQDGTTFTVNLPRLPSALMGKSGGND